MTDRDECQLCRLKDYRGDEINEPEGIATVAREDGGTKTIHCCERCADELWTGHDFTPHSQLATDGGTAEDEAAIPHMDELRLLFWFIVAAITVAVAFYADATGMEWLGWTAFGAACLIAGYEVRSYAE